MKIFFIFMLFTLCLSSYAQKKFEATYSSSTIEVSVKNNTLFITRYKQVAGQNPANPIPAEIIPERSQKNLTNQEIQNLKNCLQKSKFTTLPKNVYGASEKERFYAYTLDIKNLNNRSKKVLYRSGQINEPAPEAFRLAEQCLLDLAK